MWNSGRVKLFLNFSSGVKDMNQRYDEPILSVEEDDVDDMDMLKDKFNEVVMIRSPACSLIYSMLTGCGQEGQARPEQSNRFDDDADPW